MTNKKLRTVGCIMEIDGKFLLLHRKSEKSHGDTWALPAGKVDSGENDEQAIIREVFEETGYKASPEELELLGVFSFVTPDYSVDFPTFRIKLKQPIFVKHRPDEHQNYKWVTPEECSNIPNLIHDLPEVLEKTGYGKNRLS